MSTADESTQEPKNSVGVSALQHPSIAEAIAQAGEFAAKQATSIADIHTPHYGNMQHLRSGAGDDLIAAARLLDNIPDNAYRISQRKLQRYRKGFERRAMKDSLSDRRSNLRFDSDGNVQRDRRSTNRLANLACLRAQIKH